MPVIALQNLSKVVTRDILRDGMRAAVADANDPFTDPKAGTRPAKSGFILTSFPDRDPFYPLIVVKELNRSGGRMDRRASVQRRTYSAQILIASENATHLFQLRDQIDGWLLRKHDWMNQQGYFDVIVVSSTPTTWEPTASVKSWQITLQGKVIVN